MNKQQLITIALGSAFAAFTLSPAHAAGNPFAAKTLDAGYQVAQADMKMDKKMDDKMDKKMDDKMDKKMDDKMDKKMHDKMDKKMDEKCGEAKCGTDMKK